MKVLGRSAVWLFGLLVCLVILAPPTLVADHHWWNGSLHWPAFPVVGVTVGDNVSSSWAPFLDEAVDDWNDDPTNSGFQDVVELVIGNGSTSPRNCRPASGRIEVCNSAYGDNGWLGMTQAWLESHVAGDDLDAVHVHITQATLRLNDTYMASGYYSSNVWKETVTCHELGHTIGLGHLDEDFVVKVSDSCMEYQDPPGGNVDPDGLDFETLEFIYATFFTGPHPTTPVPSSGPGKGNGKGKFQANPGDASSWGQLVASGLRESVFEAVVGDNQRVVTWVLWAN